MVTLGAIAIHRHAVFSRNHFNWETNEICDVLEHLMIVTTTWWSRQLVLVFGEQRNTA